MLFAKRNTNDGDAKKDSKEQVSQANPDAANEDPYHIHDHGKAAARCFVIDDLTAKWPQG